MKDLDSLTKRGQIRRFRRLAINALNQFDLRVASLPLVGWYTNLIFRVKTLEGSSYIIRICAPGWRTDNDLQSETRWLQDLAEMTEIEAPVPVASRKGDYLVMAAAPGIPEPRRCMVMSWVPGTPFERHLTAANLFKLGVLFARLHEFSASYSPPDGFTRRKMDTLYAREEADVLFLVANTSAFTPKTKVILERTWEKVNQVHLDLYADPSSLRVIHNDLWHGNIKIFRGRLIPLDFEDTVWGYPVQDLAMALQDLMQDTSPSEFEPLQAALRAGYVSRLAWPEAFPGQVDTFRAGRMLWVANWVACYQNQYLAEHLDRISPLLEQYLETGRLRKPASV